MEEYLAYFRQANTDPGGTPAGSVWWAANAGVVERVLPLLDYVRLRHRRMLGAR